MPAFAGTLAFDWGALVMPAGNFTAFGSASEVESFIKDYFGAWQGTDEDRILSFYADNVTVQIPGVLMQGKAALREQFVRPFITGFPGNRHVVTKWVFGSNCVVAEWSFEAVQRGPFAGHAATEARINVPGCGVYELDPVDRLITSARIYFDLGTLLKQMLDRHAPHLRHEDFAASAAGTIATPVEHVDLATLVSVSQAVAGELVLDKLIDALMRAAVAHARAERALLVLFRGYEPRIVAEATAVSGAVTIHRCDEPVGADVLPGVILRHVLRTRENVTLDDAAAANPFSHDAYLADRGVRSVFCLPLTNQAKLIGVLYLENNHASGVFAPVRTAALKLLASQAAISLENSRLYAELAERESRIRRLVDSNIIGIFRWELEGTIYEANDAFLTMVGYDRDDLDAGRLRWTDITPPEWRDRDGELMAKLETSGKLQPFEKEYFRKDGSRVSVLIGVAAYENNPTRGVAYVIDLTQRKRAEEALREREREADLILETIPGLAAVLTPTGAVEAINHELVDYCGQPLEAMKEWGTNGTVHAQDLPHIVPVFTAAIETGQPYDFEARIRRFDGSYHWCQVRGLPMRDTNGSIVRWYVLLSDIDDRKRAEDAIEKARAEFAHVARVTTLSALTASIAHEVNQPLSGIITNAGTCLRMLDTAPPDIDGARETARRTIRDGNRASAVITRLRALFSKREFAPEPLDLNDAVCEVIALLSSDLQRDRIALTTELADNLSEVTGDRIQLQQVVLNLVRNASEAMADVTKAPRELTITTEMDERNDVRLAVRDTGVGLSPDGIDSLFDAFHTTKSGGMGIGLYVCRSIIGRHNGRLWAEANRDGPGATFSFTIPPSERFGEKSDVHR